MLKKMEGKRVTTSLFLLLLVICCAVQIEAEGEASEVAEDGSGDFDNYDLNDYCPTKEVLENENGYPRVVPHSSYKVIVNWTDLWPSLGAQVGQDESHASRIKCVDSVIIVINDEAVVVVNDVDSTFVMVNVEPCQDLRTVVRLNLKDQTSVDSFTNAQNQTYLGPKFSEAASLEVDFTKDIYDAIDLASLTIKGKFTEIAEDYECHRVERVELVIKPKGQEDNDLLVKDLGIFQDLDVSVESPKGICQAYDIALRLHGVEGTDSATKVLATIEPGSKTDTLLAAKDSGYRHQFLTKDLANLLVAIKTDKSLGISWDPLSEDECLDGYKIEVVDETGTFSQTHYMTKASQLFMIPDGLEPCTKYFLTVDLFLGKQAAEDGEENVPLFKTSGLGFIEVTTKPETVEPFAITSMAAFIGKTSLTLSWEEDWEWAQCIGEDDLKISLCSRYLDRSSCFTTSKPKSSSVLFKSLESCTEYQVLTLSFGQQPSQ